jgi:hypothetical protein
MSLSKGTLLAIGTAATITIAAGVSTFAVAQWQNSPLMRGFSDNWSSTPPTAAPQLDRNEGIYIDMKDFKVTKGAAKGDPTEQIAKLGAKEIKDGAFVFRSGSKLYIVDGSPPAKTQ